MLSLEERKSLVRARELWEKDDLDKAWHIVRVLMREHPYDRDCLYMAGHIYEKSNDLPIAYHMFKLALGVDAKEPSGWLNFGRVAEDLWRTEEAEKAYQRALSLSGRDDTKRVTLGNMAALCVDNGRFKEAENWAKSALDIWPDFEGARSNLGFAQLGQGKWSEGWKNYHSCIGTKLRTKIQYKDEPEWDGTPGKNVVLYGEQGLGDEIVFASMVPDAIRDCKKVIIDCDARLERLFKRSFPCPVYGTRKAKPEDGRKWNPEDREIDASLPIGQLGEFYRLTPESFTTTKYLKACPIRSQMWREHFKDKFTIGIAWSGGTWKNWSKGRFAPLDDWLPLFNAFDARFVCLQYRDAQKEIDQFKEVNPKIDLVQYPWATLSQDYDDTAALVDALDCVVSVPTSIVHLSCALGTKTVAMKSDKSCWKFNSGLLFHPEVNLIEWAGSWKDTISNAIPRISEMREAA